MADQKKTKMMDGNEAAASIAHRLSEVIIIYPITPSSTMGEFAEAWSAEAKVNIWDKVPEVFEMQAESGAIGAVHGALQAGALATTFTASQGLLLMIPNMYKIAGELTSFVMHVSARTVAAHALSIFGDHSDVMACRQTGFAMLASASVQEAHDMAAISHYATSTARVPFIHFFDGFRTSHEVDKITYIPDATLKEYIGDSPIFGGRDRSMSPDHPQIRGTAQNPDVFFQIREASNPYYDACISHVEAAMKRFGEVVGRKYNLIDYAGAPDAEKVIIVMGSAAETTQETLNFLNAKGAKYGVLNLHLYRPFPKDALVKALPASVKTLYVLDRTKEPGSLGEPLYLDVTTALAEAMAEGKLKALPKIFHGRFGLSSKEFTPAMAKAVFENDTKPVFTVGINDDVTNLSLAYDANFAIESEDVTRALFFGLGSDGTVGANKNSIKIIADDGGFEGQAYFVYDSKKSGAMTTSHLRFSKKQIKAPYLVEKASFVACHHFPFVDRIDMLQYAVPGAVFLLNAPYEEKDVWNSLPQKVQEQIIEKKLKFYAIDAVKVAREVGMGRRINTIMQTCFFAVSGVLPRDEAIAEIKKSIEKTYGKKGADVVQSNFKAVDGTLANLHEIKVPEKATSTRKMLPGMPNHAPELLRKVTGPIIEGRGEQLPVSAFLSTADGTWPSNSASYEKRCVATEAPVWDTSLCIQCGKCSMVCPHAAVRVKVAANVDLAKAPENFKSTPYKGKEYPDSGFIVQVFPEDCTGCSMCHQVCPGKAKDSPEKKALMMEPIEHRIDQKKKNVDFFLTLPDVDRTKIETKTVKQAQLLRPLFEFSGACAGCGETPYIKLVTQLFGDRALIANATGCSSIYGGNLPTTPYAVGADGRGPAWSNSLFEDNAEYGYGMRCAVDFQKSFAGKLLASLESEVGGVLVNDILKADQSGAVGIAAQRERVAELKKKLAASKAETAKQLLQVADYLVDKSVWIFGGDGWAYDIGYGGLDHVLYSGKNVNVLVLDTGVYSNTGGQKSKATPLGASAKFASAGSDKPQKDLGMIAMASENVYVAKVAFGANDAQTLRAFTEAESFNGPSLIIAYAHCIAHGYDLSRGLDHQKMAVETGLWPLYRFDPRLIEQGKVPLQLDSKAPSKDISEFMDSETRFKISQKANPEHYKKLVAMAQSYVKQRRDLYETLASSEDAPKA